jgi:hypothetical protein
MTTFLFGPATLSIRWLDTPRVCDVCGKWRRSVRRRLNLPDTIKPKLCQACWTAIGRS